MLRQQEPTHSILLFRLGRGATPSPFSPDLMAKNPETAERMRRLWADPEFRAKRSAAIKRAHSKPDLRAKRRRITTKLWRDPAYRERASAALREAQNRPEVRQRKSESIRRALAAPEQRERLGRPRRRKVSDFAAAWFGLDEPYVPEGGSVLI